MFMSTVPSSLVLLLSLRFIGSVVAQAQPSVEKIVTIPHDTVTDNLDVVVAEGSGK